MFLDAHMPMQEPESGQAFPSDPGSNCPTQEIPSLAAPQANAKGNPNSSRGTVVSFDPADGSEDDDEPTVPTKRWDDCQAVQLGSFPQGLRDQF